MAGAKRHLLHRHFQLIAHALGYRMSTRLLIWILYLMFFLFGVRQAERRHLVLHRLPPHCRSLHCPQSSAVQFSVTSIKTSPVSLSRELMALPNVAPKARFVFVNEKAAHGHFW